MILHFSLAHLGSGNPALSAKISHVGDVNNMLQYVRFCKRGQYLTLHQMVRCGRKPDDCEVLILFFEIC